MPLDSSVWNLAISSLCLVYVGKMHQKAKEVVRKCKILFVLKMQPKI